VNKFLASLALWSVIMSSTSAPAAEIPVYLASPHKDSGGIYRATLDADSGKLSEPARVAETKCSFLAQHPSKRFLYAVGDDKISALAIDAASGTLTPLNSQPCGRGPCFVSIDASGKNALIANYGGGSVAVVPIKRDGSLGEMSASIQHAGNGPNPKRQDKPHPHSIALDPVGTTALAPDLGLDQLKRYKLDTEAGTLVAADPPFIATPAGGGPRHFDFHPNEKWLYVNNEMGCSVTAIDYGDGSNAKEIQTITSLTREPTDADTTSQIEVHSSGRFLYVANRGPNDIASFAIDGATGKLTSIGHTPTEGQIPRHFSIDPTGKWLLVANQGGEGVVVVLKIDQKTGSLSATGNSVKLAQPMCVLYP
jgi:6-phosphogluconolactonase